MTQENTVAIEATTEATVAPQENGFLTLGLAPALVQAVADMGYTQPTEVQLRAIPLALQKAAEQGNSNNYVDLMVSSKTGSGKTAAFLLPVLHTLIEMEEQEKIAEKEAFNRSVTEALARGEEAPRKAKRKNPLNRKFSAAEPGALVLCPTRELAMQVASDAIDLIRHNRGIRIASVIGGLPYPKQIAQLQGANLVVATPGRLLDLQRSGQIKLEGVKFLVLDEADRMLDLGFSEDLEDISRLTHSRNQTMMFSATFAPRIQQLAMSVMHDNGRNAQKIEITSAQAKHENITQKLFWADTPEHKRALLDAWLRSPDIDQAIVFASTQIECDNLATDLQQVGFSAVALHGALSQGMRMRRLEALRNGRVQILVATDVAARGIDVPTITHVFNFGLPMKAEDYTHRIGRTGRAGRQGLAVSFAEFRDRRRIFDIENFTRQKLEAVIWPGLEPRQRPPEMRNERRGGGAGGAGGRNGGGANRGRPAGGSRGGFGGKPSGRGDFGGGRGEFGGSRGGFGDDRGPRRDFGNRSEGAGRPEGGAGRGDFAARPQRDGFAPRGDRPARPEFGDRGNFGGGNRGGDFGARKEGGEFRKSREFGDAPRKSAGAGAGHGAPRSSFKAKEGFGGGKRPARSNAR